MNVLITGYGNIGSTLTAALTRWRKEFELDEIIVARRAIPSWEEAEMEALKQTGVTVWYGDLHGDEGAPIRKRVNFVFHAGPNGSGLAARDEYDAWPVLVGAVAQGSEKGFGAPFMAGLPPSSVTGRRFVQVVSCNTHGLASVLQWLAGPDLERLVDVDAVIVRRSEDLANHERLVGGPVVARHRDATCGTHHAKDVVDLFESQGLAAKVTSSDITTQGQLLHTLRFSVRLSGAVAPDDLRASLAGRPWLAQTSRFDGNRIFETGRRTGFQGRLYAHAIVVAHDLLISGDTVRGWAFVPQEGNTIGSTLEAFLLQTGRGGGLLSEEVRSGLVVPLV